MIFMRKAIELAITSGKKGSDAFVPVLVHNGEINELSCDEIVGRLERDVEVVGPILEEEGMKAFEYWGGDYRSLEEFLEEAHRAREGRA
jgi:hypothetical protein